jgi:hypothetical protein
MEVSRRREAKARVHPVVVKVALTFRATSKTSVPLVEVRMDELPVVVSLSE